MESFPEILRRERAKTGMGYEAFAKHVLGGVVSHQAVRDIEEENFIPRILTIKAIAEKLKLDWYDVAYAVFGLDPPSESTGFEKLERTERSLVDKFRQLNRDGQFFILGQIEMALMNSEMKNEAV